MARSSMNQDQAPLSLSWVNLPAMKLWLAANEVVVVTNKEAAAANETATGGAMARNVRRFIDKG